MKDLAPYLEGEANPQIGTDSQPSGMVEKHK